MNFPKLYAVVGFLLLVGMLAACGGGESAGGQKKNPQQAFLQSMVPHHRSAVAWPRGFHHLPWLADAVLRRLPLEDLLEQLVLGDVEQLTRDRVV